MGCDIHCYVEKLGDDGIWRSVDPVGNDPRWTSPGQLNWDFGRNYCSFAVMADVRNDYGMKPIAEPRGLPADVSAELRAHYEGWGPDGHSHSWLLLSELLAFDFSQTVSKVGVVSLGEFRTFLKEGKPTSWSGDVGGPMVKKVSVADMKRIAEEGPPDTSSYYTQITWPDSYKDSCPSLVRFIEKLKKIGAPDKVRAVFWFDN